MGQDWPKGDEPACGKFALGMLGALAVLAIAIPAALVWAVISAV